MRTAKSIFITGTDTSVGKTYVTLDLINSLNLKGYKTFGIKPVASGCKKNRDGSLQNEDALRIQKTSSLYKPYNIVNPIALQKPIAPSIAASSSKIELSVTYIIEKILSSIQETADINLIEGIGGWAVPINDSETFAEVISILKIPTILVVGIKLGCLNHAILTSDSIRKMRVPFIGWIANCLEKNTLAIEQNISTLKKWLPTPCLNVIPYITNNAYDMTASVVNNAEQSYGDIF